MPSRSTFSRDLIANETAEDWRDALGLLTGAEITALLAAYQALDATLTSLAAFNTNGLLTQTAADTFVGRSIAVSGTGLGVSNPAGTAGDPTVTITPSSVVGAVHTAATQTEQEAASDTSQYVTPSRQQFHPSAAKCWAYVTVSAGTPTLAASYNITSITDTATGKLTVTIATDFSSANWAAMATVTEDPGHADTVSNLASQAAGSVVIQARRSPTAGLDDPAAWHFSGFGDQ